MHLQAGPAAQERLPLVALVVWYCNLDHQDLAKAKVKSGCTPQKQCPSIDVSGCHTHNAALHGLRVKETHFDIPLCVFRMLLHGRSDHKKDMA
jgi:hypothetical protein